MSTDGPPMSHLMKIPTELHFCIRNQLLADPDITVKQLRPLRLVCRTFNDIWTPIVVTKIVLFQKGSTDHAFAQLRHLVHDASTLTAYRTLTIQNLCCVDTNADRLYSDVRRLSNQGITAILKQMRTVLFLILLYLLFFVFFFFPVLLQILYLVIHPVQAIRHLKIPIQKFRARYYMALLPRKLNMPNIRHVKLVLSLTDSDWVIYRSTRILLSLPHLTELELSFTDTTDMEYLSRCLAHVNRLRKLALWSKFKPTTSSQLRCFATLISNNENLTHLDWRLPDSPKFSELFCDIPANKPLKLSHLSLNRGCSDFDALIPHIRSLETIEFHYPGSNRWCVSLERAKIYPQTIKVELLDHELIAFIRNHPGIVSLKIGSSTIMQGIEEPGLSLCKALTNHSETLEYLFVQSKVIAFMLQDAENEADFLQSAANLRELVLETEETLRQYRSETFCIINERKILPVIAHLSHTLTVVIRTKDKGVFFLCVAFCSKSEDPLVRDLAGRIVYEKV